MRIFLAILFLSLSAFARVPKDQWKLGNEWLGRLDSQIKKSLDECGKVGIPIIGYPLNQLSCKDESAAERGLEKVKTAWRQGEMNSLRDLVFAVEKFRLKEEGEDVRLSSAEMGVLILESPKIKDAKGHRFLSAKGECGLDFYNAGMTRSTLVTERCSGGGIQSVSSNADHVFLHKNIISAISKNIDELASTNFKDAQKLVQKLDGDKIDVLLESSGFKAFIFLHRDADVRLIGCESEEDCFKRYVNWHAREKHKRDSDDDSNKGKTWYSARFDTNALGERIQRFRPKESVDDLRRDLREKEAPLPDTVELENQSVGK